MNILNIRRVHLFKNFMDLSSWAFYTAASLHTYGTPLQYSCLENPMDGGAWKAAVHGVAEGRTRLSDFTSLFTFTHRRRKWQPTPVFLPGESQGQGSLLGCRLWGHTESDTTEETQQQQQPYTGFLHYPKVEHSCETFVSQNGVKQKSKQHTPC